MVPHRISELLFTFLVGLFLLSFEAQTNPLELRGTTRLVARGPQVDKLYDEAASNKVNVGNTKEFTFKRGQALKASTAEFYGCTVVVAADAKGAIIGHYAQQGSSGCIDLTDQTATKNNIVAPLQRENMMLDFDESSHAYIIESAGTKAAGYELVVDALEAMGLKKDNIKDFHYTATTAAKDFKNGDGKLVVTWGPDGKDDILEIYIQDDKPKVSQKYTYDKEGNPHGA